MLSKGMRNIMDSLEVREKTSLTESASKPVSNQIKDLITEGYTAEQIIEVISKSPVLREHAVKLLGEQNASSKSDWINQIVESTTKYTIIVETKDGKLGRKTFESREIALEWVSARKDHIVTATAIENLMELDFGGMARGVMNKVSGKEGKGKEHFTRLMNQVGIKPGTPEAQAVANFVKSLPDPSNSEYYNSSYANSFMKKNNLDRASQQAIYKVLQANDQQEGEWDQRQQAGQRSQDSANRAFQGDPSQAQHAKDQNQLRNQSQGQQSPRAGMGGGAAQDDSSKNVLGGQKVKPGQEQNQNLPQFNRIQR